MLAINHILQKLSSLQQRLQLKCATQEKSHLNIILRFPNSIRVEQSCSYDDSVKVDNSIAYATYVTRLPLFNRSYMNLHSVCVELKR